MLKVRTGDRLGDWEVDHVLSFGSPALVAAHKAADKKQKATLKVTERAENADRLQQLEIAALESFDHPVIPKVVDSGAVEDGPFFIAIPKFSGETLADRMVAERVDWHVACMWLFDIAKALQVIHNEGWVHRGVTPNAIYVGARDTVLLMGMEGARPLDESGHFESAAGGYMTYVAPEVIADPEYHAPRADLYAFGCVAYEVLTGKSPFPAAAFGDAADRDQMMIEWKTRTTALDPGDEFPGWLRSLIKKCTNPDSNQRLPDFDTVVNWLEASKAVWTPPEAKSTPPAVPRQQMPALNLRPSLKIDPKELAAAIALQTAHLQPDNSAKDDMFVMMAAGIGSAVGLAAAVLAVFYTELTML